VRWEVNGPEGEKVGVHRRKLHNEELHDIYHIRHYYVRQVKNDEGWAGHVAGIGENKIQYNILARTPEGKGPLEKSRRRRKIKRKYILKELGELMWSGFIRLIEGTIGRLK